MSTLRALEPLRLSETDLLDVLQPRPLLIALAASVVFGALALVGLGKPVLALVVIVGSIVALVRPSYGFVICVFLFAFRNEAFQVGPFKVADPLFAVTFLSFVLHAALQNRLKLHTSLIYVGLFFATGLLSGLNAQFGTRFAMDAIRLTYFILIYVIALQVMDSKQLFLLSIKAFMAAGLVMAVCSVLGFVDRFALHGNGAPFSELEGGLGGFRMQSIAVDPLRVPAFLVLPMMLAAGLEQLARNPRERRTAIALFWFGFLSCILSFTRSFVLQLFPALIIMWLLTRRHLSKLGWICAMVATPLVIISFMPLDSEFARQYRLDRWAIAGKLASGRTEPRELIWGATIKAFAANPVVGVGLDNFIPRYFEYRDPWRVRGWIYWHQKATHSTYMTVLSEMGVIGTVVCLTMLGYFAVLGLGVTRRARADGDRTRYLIAAAVLASYVAHVIASIALDLLAHNHMWVIMAFIAILDRRSASGAESESSEAAVTTLPA